MSIYGFAGRAASKYKSLLNLSSAKRLTSAGMRSGGIVGAGAGIGRWAMGGNMAQKATRIGTIGAAAYAGRQALSGVGAVGGGLYQLGRTPWNILQKGNQPGPF